MRSNSYRSSSGTAISEKQNFWVMLATINRPLCTISTNFLRNFHDMVIEYSIFLHAAIVPCTSQFAIECIAEKVAYRPMLPLREDPVLWLCKLFLPSDFGISSEYDCCLQPIFIKTFPSWVRFSGPLLGFEGDPEQLEPFGLQLFRTRFYSCNFQMFYGICKLAAIVIRILYFVALV